MTRETDAMELIRESRIRMSHDVGNNTTVWLRNCASTKASMPRKTPATSTRISASRKIRQRTANHIRKHTNRTNKNDTSRRSVPTVSPVGAYLRDASRPTCMTLAHETCSHPVARSQLARRSRGKGGAASAASAL